jgi:murein DD-endopeptidase MepM/ murein hydrolase activator NlpD
MAYGFKEVDSNIWGSEGGTDYFGSALAAVDYPWKGWGDSPSLGLGSMGAGYGFAQQDAGFGFGGAVGSSGMPSYFASSFGFNPGGALSAAEQAGMQGAGNPTAGLGETGYAMLDQHNADIAKAAAKHGVPANLVKTILNREGSGDWVNNNRVAYLRGSRILPFVGMFQAAMDRVGYDFDKAIGNKAYQIEALAAQLKSIYNNEAGQNWDNTIKVHFGGPQALNGTFTDELGMNSNQYYQSAKDLWMKMDRMGGADSSQWSGYGAGGGLVSIFGHGNVPDWGGFNVKSSLGYYGYGTQFGLSGDVHTGLDIPGSYGSPYKAPAGGTVLCAGTGQGRDHMGGSCDAFGDTKGGAGRVEVMLDNGAVLIFGHSASSAFRPGQRFNAGQTLGTIGYMNSDHVHLEARVKDPSKPSGWKIVDPREVLGSGGASGNYGAAGPTNFTSRIQQIMMRNYGR